MVTSHNPYNRTCAVRGNMITRLESRHKIKKQIGQWNAVLVQ